MGCSFRSFKWRIIHFNLFNTSFCYFYSRIERSEIREIEQMRRNVVRWNCSKFATWIVVDCRSKNGHAFSKLYECIHLRHKTNVSKPKTKRFQCRIKTTVCPLVCKNLPFCWCHRTLNRGRKGWVIFGSLVLLPMWVYSSLRSDIIALFRHL